MPMQTRARKRKKSISPTYEQQDPNINQANSTKIVMASSSVKMSYKVVQKNWAV